MQAEKTILGVTLRRRIITTVNGMGRGDRISVIFKGTRAYTNGKTIVLPAIRDLAEIPYSTARALIGYAIHEVSHVRYTDFEAIIRAIEAGKMEPDALIKKFENAIEDYRIERKISREFPGSASDLEALRNLIHPPLKRLKPAWMADPRACGPLALTWTGSLLNGFRVTEVQTTLDAIPAPVRALIDNWTVRMTNVASTEEAVDLAIAFTKEAMDYADMSRQQPQSGSSGDQDQSDPQDQQDSATPQSQDDQNDADDQNKDDDQADPETSDGDADEDDSTSDDAGADEADEADDASNDDSGDDGADAAADNSDASNDEPDAEDGDKSDMGSPCAGKSGEPGSQGDPQDQAGDGSPGDSGNQNNQDGSGGGESDDGVDDFSFGGSSPTGEGQSDPNGGQSPDQSGKIGMNDGMTDEYDDGTGEPDPSAPSSDDAPTNGNDAGDATDPNNGDQADDQNTAGAGSSQSSDEEGDSADQSDTAPAAGSGAGDNGDDDQDALGDPSDSMGDMLSDQLDQQAGSSEGADSDGEDNHNPLKDVLDENAELDDLLDDLRDALAQNPLPEDVPDATDGEVDPGEVLKNVKAANAAAPDFQSPDPDPNAEKSDQEGGEGASKNHYHDNRFSAVNDVEEDDNQFEVLRSAAAGIIATTARTIRRLLMAEEQRGVLRNKRAGQFDIRNISAIVRNTGACYKKKWEKPAPKTHLMLLTDFSGSMMMGSSDFEFNVKGATRLSLAMTGALAIEEATRNTQIETSIYGYSGYSPHVNLSVFKDGRQRHVSTRRKIGSYLEVEKGCTPTAEAMIAVADILDHLPEDRRVLVVLTDGDADDMPLCAAVVPVLRRRGIEVVAIGIMKDSVKTWCPDHYVINDIAQLPTALLSIIDPRGHKKVRKAA